MTSVDQHEETGRAVLGGMTTRRTAVGAILLVVSSIARSPRYPYGEHSPCEVCGKAVPVIRVGDRREPRLRRHFDGSNRRCPGSRAIVTYKAQG